MLGVGVGVGKVIGESVLTTVVPVRMRCLRPLAPVERGFWGRGDTAVADMAVALPWTFAPR